MRGRDQCSGLGVNPNKVSGSKTDWLLWLGMRDSEPPVPDSESGAYHLANPQRTGEFREKYFLQILILRRKYFFDKWYRVSTMPPFLGSSVVEQLAVNQLVVGSNPTWEPIRTFLKEEAFCFFIV